MAPPSNLLPFSRVGSTKIPVCSWEIPRPGTIPRRSDEIRVSGFQFCFCYLIARFLWTKKWFCAFVLLQKKRSHSWTTSLRGLEKWSKEVSRVKHFDKLSPEHVGQFHHKGIYFNWVYYLGVERPIDQNIIAVKKMDDYINRSQKRECMSCHSGGSHGDSLETVTRQRERGEV